MKKINKTIDSEDSLGELAASLAKNVKVGDVILLIGDLGAGKTSFVKYFVRQFSSDIEVVSPTYPILNIYEPEGYKIFHYDLYRVKNLEELEEINFTENMERGITLVEWPEIIYSFLPKKFTVVKLKQINHNQRIVEIEQYEK